MRTATATRTCTPTLTATTSRYQNDPTSEAVWNASKDILSLTEDGTWYDMLVQFNNGIVTVSVGNAPVLNSVRFVNPFASLFQIDDWLSRHLQANDEVVRANTRSSPHIPWTDPSYRTDRSCDNSTRCASFHRSGLPTTGYWRGWRDSVAHSHGDERTDTNSYTDTDTDQHSIAKLCEPHDSPRSGE